MEIKLPYYINHPSGIIGDSPTSKILIQSDALAYHQSLKEYASAPLVNLKILAKKINVAELWVKDESNRFGLGSFKALGASYAVNELLKKNKSISTFCTATDGNHGKALAWSADLKNRNAIIYVPHHTTKSRIEAIERYGATVIATHQNYDETCALAAKTAAQYNWQLVQDTAWKNYETIPALIMAGYLTHFKELENSLHTPHQPKIDFVFLQAGVGSWAAAAAWYYAMRYAQHRPKLIIVEPKSADGILESFKQNRLSQPTGDLTTIMAGLNCGVPSYSAWPILKNTIHYSMHIHDSAAENTMRQLYQPDGDDLQLTSGESGAAGIAGLLELMNNPVFEHLKHKIGINKNSRVLCFNTEGITDPENFRKIVGHKCISYT
jgi:diaminopropionate ammonia-lyase